MYFLFALLKPHRKNNIIVEYFSALLHIRTLCCHKRTSCAYDIRFHQMGVLSNLYPIPNFLYNNILLMEYLIFTLHQ